MHVDYEIADFVTGETFGVLPIKKGAEWTTQLNRPDQLSCTVDMRSREARGLDLSSAAEGRKTVLRARTVSDDPERDDLTVAWGLLDDQRPWNEDTRTLKLSAKGVESSWLGMSLIGPATALTLPLIVKDDDGLNAPNPALDTHYAGLELGTIAKRLVEQRLTWPGSPAARFTLPADRTAPADEDHQRDYLFAQLKYVGEALQNLTEVENGPDIAFDCWRAADGRLAYGMRVGTDANPRIGADVGIWALGPASPISGLEYIDDSVDVATTAWGSAGRTMGDVLLSRVRNADMIADGYPSLDYVNTSHGDVTRQATLDAYARADAAYVRRPRRDVPFSVQGDASPGLGQYRAGDFVTIDVPADHPWPPMRGGFRVRVTSLKGDETGRKIAIGCEVI